MPYQILGDVHTHTLFSRHAYSTIAENVAAARTAGMEVLGSADHFSCMLFPEQSIRNFQFFLNTTVWPRVWDGVTVLRGAEVDIIGLDGELFGQKIPVTGDITGQPYARPSTLFERATRDLDYLVASVHDGDFAKGATLAQTTQMYIDVLEDPKVFILGHTGRSGVPYDIDAVLTCAREKHKLIELNEHSIEQGAQSRCYDTCRTIAERCAELGVGVAVNSDAHLAPYIGRYRNVCSMLEEINFPQELIVNRSRDAFVQGLADAGVCDLAAEVAAALKGDSAC